MAERARGSDVVVLGAGPAGCAAAILCAERGLTVTLVERHAFPRDRPGESLHPGVESLLRQLRVLDAVQSAGFLRHTGIWIGWADAPRFEEFGRDADGPWYGYQAWRADLDALLLERARALGVTILQPCKAESVSTRAGRIAGVRTSRGHLGARFVIDATGGCHWLARRLRLPIERRSPRLIVRFGYVRGSCPDRDEAPVLVADARGWTWTARVRPDIYQWTRLTWCDERRPRDWRPIEIRGLEPDGAPRGADVSWRIVSAPAGPGYFLTGDAACLLDPAASHGVLRAFMSGMMAAHLIVKIVHGEAEEAEAVRAYSDWLRGWFESDVERLKGLYARLPGGGWARGADGVPSRSERAADQDRDAGRADVWPRTAPGGPRGAAATSVDDASGPRG